MRVRFADLRSVTRSATLSAPVSATIIIAEIAEELVRRYGSVALGIFRSVPGEFRELAEKEL